MSENVCGNCEWFEMIENEYGECRKNPPVIIEKLVGGNSYTNLFQASKCPLVSKNHWCGDFVLNEIHAARSDSSGNL